MEKNDDFIKYFTLYKRNFQRRNISYWYKKYFNLILFLIIIVLAVRVEK